MRSVRGWLRKSLTVAAGAALLLLPATANAELGGNENSVKADQQRLRGSLQVNRAQSYAVHEIRTDSNAVVREYVSPAGKVFGVSYHGPVIGESNSVLGSYSAQLAQAMKSAHNGRHMGGPVIVRVGDVVYEATGHLRSYHVRAYVASAVPQGVATEEIR
ncbi:hypothetical protein Acid345_1363 [Candidatus Koribacter versatilis Ellin345]|uniref:Uncharacterized protein n=1 Tax=Koribacter versatilis (strain Ellin345) TaxID=204669 RepID=Q1IRY5_KORVE|nr:DUF2844 domain-containing protein [Candidatus Koribacter versatilis]ABF40365.1 hypothetical protein Acid345_1363 [Candidatus Koribacter versatilis Ellin345]